MIAEVKVDRPDGFTVDVRLEVSDSETIALVGPNGAGKTTVLLAMAGLIGDGSTVSFHRGGGRVGVVFQNGLLFPHMTVRENVDFGARLDVDQLMSSLGIGHLSQRRPDELSGGEAQRVALARTLAIDPDMLLLDEPMSALDATSRLEMRRFLRSTFDDFEGPKVLVAHDPVDAFGLADRVYVMEQGHIVQEGTPEDLRQRPATPYVADLVGTNLMLGRFAGGLLTVGGLQLHVASPLPDGEVLVRIHPRSVVVHPTRPTGSARNVWSSSVAHVDLQDEVARVTFDEPIALTAELTRSSVAALDIDVGSDLFVAIKATEVSATPR